MTTTCLYTCMNTHPAVCLAGDGVDDRDIGDATHRINFPPVIAIPPSSLFAQGNSASCTAAERRNRFFNFLPEITRIGCGKNENTARFILRDGYASNYAPGIGFSCNATKIS